MAQIGDPRPDPANNTWGGPDYSFTATAAGPVPHRCPVCEGRGSVPNGFYVQSEGTNDQPCQACGGTGVLWR